MVSDSHVEYQNGTIVATRDAIGEDPAVLPEAFRSKSESENFAIFIQYLLSLIFDDSFQPIGPHTHEDEYFAPAIRAIHRKLESFRSGAAQSDLWKDPLLADLNQLPEYDLVTSHAPTVNNHCQALSLIHI